MERAIKFFLLLLLAITVTCSTSFAAPRKIAKATSTAYVEKKLVPSDQGDLQRYDFFKNKKKIASQLLNPNAQIIKQEGDIPDGVVREFENGTLKTEERYKGNKRNGDYKEFYYDGAVHVWRHFKDGKEHGKTRIFTETGALITEGNYVEGNLKGKEIEYYEDGKVLSEKGFVNGLQHGPVTEYYENGKIRAQSLFLGSDQATWLKLHSNSPKKRRFQRLEPHFQGQNQHCKAH